MNSYGSAALEGASGRRSYCQQHTPLICNTTAELYCQYWGEHLHFAIFEPDEDESIFDAALERTHKRYFSAVDGLGARRILDIACGSGAFSEWMARRTAGDVVGIDTSDAHIGRAQVRTRRVSRHNLSFAEHDAMCVAELPGAPFDAAVCLDAACYFPDMGDAFSGVAARLLPGAKLLVVDRCRAPSVNLLQQELVLDPFCHLWGIPHLEPVHEYRRALARSGFRVLAVDDLTNRTMPNWERSYRAAECALAEIPDPIDLIRLAAAALRYGSDGAALLKEQFNATLLAKAAADFGLVRYVAFLAECV